MIEESGENKLAGAVTRVGRGGRSRVEGSGVWARPRAASSWLHTDNMKTPFESSPLATQRGQRGSSMRKAKKLAADELRSEYHCCPARSRIESVDWRLWLNRFGSLVLAGPVKWAFFRKA